MNASRSFASVPSRRGTSGPAKITKVGALYRPRAIPILDTRISAAYGYRSLRGRPGAQREVVESLAAEIREQEPLLRDAKQRTQGYVVDFRGVSLLRFADILIWTSMAGGWDQPLSSPTEPEHLGGTFRTVPLLVPAHQAQREERSTGRWARRYEVAIETPAILGRRSDWDRLEFMLHQEAEPVAIWYEGRRFTFFPGDRDHYAVVTVPFANANDYREERVATERFLSALCFHVGHPIRVVLDSASGFKGEFDAPLLWQPRWMRSFTDVARELVVENDPRLQLALGLYREGMSATSPALRVLGFWKVVEVALGVTDDKSEFREWMSSAIDEASGEWGMPEGEAPKTPGEWFLWLNDSRNAASHGLRDWAGKLTHDPHDPDTRRRLQMDADRLQSLARRAVLDSWPKAVTDGAGP